MLKVYSTNRFIALICFVKVEAEFTLHLPMLTLFLYINYKVTSFSLFFLSLIAPTDSLLFAF